MKSQIGACLIATNKYKQFVQPLIGYIEKYFLVNHDVTIFLFTDDITIDYSYRGSIIKTLIPSYKFPQATLYRYKIFDENKLLFDQLDYIFYMDVDMRIESEVDEEIFSNGLTAVHHPGFFNGGWGSLGCVKESLAYVPIHQRFNYCAGGFQGGKADVYLKACNVLNARIQDDERRGVMAEWHDESHWNWLLNSNELARAYNKLTPSYCMVEDFERRKPWGIDHLPVKIVALNKNHKELRS